MLSQYQSRMKKLREAFGNKCVKCGATDDLHFDHINPSTKYKSIAKMAPNHGYDRCYQEALKCQLLCSSCHKKKSIENRDYTTSAKLHRLTYKDGTILEVYSLDSWSYENNINPSHLRAIRRGERKSHKGIIKVETL
jgi:hypothetical protein